MKNIGILFFTVVIGVLFILTIAIAEDPEVDNRPALPFPPGISTESQCGLVNDQQDVELYDGSLGVTKDYVRANEPSTCQLQWMTSAQIGAKLPDYRQGNVASQRWCSGTLISNNLVLTAAHCFDVQDGKWGWVSPFTLNANGKQEYAKPYVLATLQQANFRYQVDGETGAVRTPAVYPVKELREYGRDSSENLDYAIVELGPDSTGKLPGESFAPAKVLTREQLEGEGIAIIQHPQGKPKKIDAGKVLNSNERYIFYNNIDTHGGSSGSGIRDSKGQIIGVHTNGGCRVNSGANRGEPTGLIYNISDTLNALSE